MDERTTSYVENGQKKTGVTRPAYNPNTDYMQNMNRAAASGDNSAAAYYEQQRNDKIAATGSQYAPTALYSQYAQDLTPAQMQQLEQGYTPSYNPNTDYSSYMQKAAGAGDYGAAGYYEQQRNKKIQGEGLGYAQTSTYAPYYGQVGKAQGATLENGYQTPQEQGYLNAAWQMMQGSYADRLEAANASAEAQNQLLRQQAERQREQQAAQYSKLGRQLYTDMMDERRLLPEQLAAQGYNGGATESSLLRNRLTYEQALRDNEAARIAGEKDIDFELAQGLSRQEIARQQAAMQLAGDYSSQYAAMMQNLQSQQNYEAEKELARRQQQLAYLEAAAKQKEQYGDFSGYALLTDLDGNRLYSDADIQQMLARWQYVQALAAATGSGGSGGGRRSSGSRRSSGRGSGSEDYSGILSQLQGNNQTANRYGTSQDKSRVTWILVNGGGRMTPEEVRRGVANGTITETTNSRGQTVYKKKR